MIEKSYDVVIIGSGAGGATVAKELAPLCAEGKRIVVLEWGPKFRDAEFTGVELKMADKAYFDSGGLLTAQRDLTLAMGRGYGGSTMVYTGTSIPLPEHVIDYWGVPGLDHADIMARTRKYMAENNVHQLDAPLVNDNNRLFAEACRRLDLTVKAFPVNIKGCKGSGMCNMGCPNQAKQGTNRVQLPQAESMGVEVVTNCRVRRIGERRVEAELKPSPYGEPSRWPAGDYRIKAKVVVVACGAVHSSALLMHSDLPVWLPALGRYFTCHPALTLIGQHDRPISNYHGFPKTYYCDDFEKTKRFILETCMYFPFTTAKNLAGFGPDHSLLMSDFRRLQMILVLAADPALPQNRITPDRDGNPEVHYHFADEVLDAFVESQKVAARIFFAAGAQRVHAPSSKAVVITRAQESQLDHLIHRRHQKLGRISISAAHMMGGCRMGSRSRDSVTNIRGQVHGIPWLFVADSSLFPKSSEVNPYLTVMSLADRVAEGIRLRARELLK